MAETKQQNRDETTTCPIRVCVRFRPPNATETSDDALQNRIVDYDPEGNAVTVQQCNGREPRRFVFDRCFGPDIQQVDVYNDISQSKIADLLDGYNSTILAYGQTGSGKTYTMEGPPGFTDDRTRQGIMPRIVSDLFDAAQAKLAAVPNLAVCVQLSYIELYRQEIFDLLAKPVTDENRNKLCLHQTDTRTWIENLIEEYVTCTSDVLELMKRGARNRTVGATQSNARSSRSHAILMLNIEQVDKNEQTTTHSKLMLVDLAGSERLSKSKAEGVRKTETQAINSSLHVLGHVINKLSSPKPPGHVPYSSSLLTRLLRDSIGGNSTTCLIITASPSVLHQQETLSSLRFGEQAKKIRNKPRVNRELSVEQYQRQVKDQQLEIDRLMKQRDTLQTALDQLRESIQGGPKDLAQVLESHEQRSTVPRVAELEQEVCLLQQTVIDLENDKNRLAAKVKYLEDEVNEQGSQILTLEDDNRRLAADAEQYTATSETMSPIGRDSDTDLLSVEEVLAAATMDDRKSYAPYYNNTDAISVDVVTLMDQLQARDNEFVVLQNKFDLLREQYEVAVSYQAQQQQQKSKSTDETRSDEDALMSVNRDLLTQLVVSRRGLASQRQTIVFLRRRRDELYHVMQQQRAQMKMAVAKIRTAYQTQEADWRKRVDHLEALFQTQLTNRRLTVPVTIRSGHKRIQRRLTIEPAPRFRSTER